MKDLIEWAAVLGAIVVIGAFSLGVIVLQLLWTYGRLP